MAERIESRPFQVSSPVIHRGSWLVGCSPSTNLEVPFEIIEDGALVLADGRIQAVGAYKNIAREFGQYHTEEHDGRVLAPALINGHCHLELSYVNIAGKTEEQGGYEDDFTVWIRKLLAKKESFFRETADAEELVVKQARHTLNRMSVEGVGFVGDVGNSLASRTIGDRQGTRVEFLLELLGLTQESETKTLARLEKIAADTSLQIGCTPHAPYSTTPSIIRAIKIDADRHDRLFSIHVAESMQEIEFLQSGSGPFKEFLLDRGAWDGSFAVPGTSSVRYLETLGVLDGKTLCVHGVHVDRAEIEIMARSGAKVCLCPGSNRFLGVGKAPVTEFLAHGMLPALGTDSKASNEVLSMWREMRLLREDHPGLDPGTVFAMATRGGAEAWGVGAELGGLAPGRQARVLAVGCHEKMHETREVLEYLTTVGESVQVEWLEAI